MRDERIPRSRTPLRHWANRTHRFVAILAVVFIVILSLTGLVLNHADALGISARGASFLSTVYGIEAPPVDTAFEAGGVMFASAAGSLYANGRELAVVSGPVRGAAVTDNGDIVIATPTELLLSTSEAVLIERTTADTGTPIRRLGSAGNYVVVGTGDNYYSVDPATMSLAAVGSIDASAVNWASPASPDEEQRRRIATQALGKVLSWERVLSDLHSGRILPVAGRYIVDIATLCLLYLCLTGIVIWWRTRTINRQ